MIWILCYDIEDDKTRRQLAGRLEKKGWERLQKSVFATAMDSKEFSRFFKMLQQQFEARLKAGDKVYAWRLSDSQFEEVVKLGQPYDARWIQGSYDVFYLGDEQLLK